MLLAPSRVQLFERSVRKITDVSFPEPVFGTHDYTVVMMLTGSSLGLVGRLHDGNVLSERCVKEFAPQLHSTWGHGHVELLGVGDDMARIGTAQLVRHALSRGRSRRTACTLVIYPTKLVLGWAQPA